MYVTIVFLPLLGFLVAGLFGHRLGPRGAQIVTSGFLVIAALLAMIGFADVALGGHEYRIPVAQWVSSGELDFHWALRIDTLTVVMLVVVTVISALVHVYSIGYMSSDPHNPRFFAYLSLFTFAMLTLVTADNFLQLFFGWEGVGLSSYLLIGFWYERPSANAAAIKAFLVNRIGDFGFSLGILAIFLVFNSVDMQTVFDAVPDHAGSTFSFLGYQLHTLNTICILLFIGAMGKSAQLGLHTWLPDAMEGPTPVSALIHAATMVTAGVFLVVRCSPMFEYAPLALDLVIFIGAATAIVTASIALVQNDIKRVIAYSTCSQLGYMFFAAGVGAYGAAMFHLFTHAFFKALLFLGSGAVIHALADEQDMRRMGGLRKALPLSWSFMVIGTLALTGVFPFAGYFSKDTVIEVAWAAQSGLGEFAFVMGVAAALMTAFYSWRLIFMTFHGAPRAAAKVMARVHEAPKIMWLPLALLALGAFASGFLFSDLFVGDGRAAFWGSSISAHGDGVLEAAHHAPVFIKSLPLIMSIGGFLLAYQLYLRRPDLPGKLARTFEWAYRFLLNKWFFDELYDFLFVRPAFRLGHFLWRRGDEGVIDRFGPDGISKVVALLAARLRRLQTGYIYHYAFAMMIGLALILTYIVLQEGGL
ncbi:MAG: NADH-quinone oxidoreductase subunit L [Proteobacteria bacterium]|nr:NADH-quinone oxidoreductase subunit L [Pseudomonadota bacterium]